MSTRTMSAHGDLNQVAETITREMQKSAISCQLVDSVKRDEGNCSSMLLVFEKYFMRASNRASLSLMLNQIGDYVTADMIGSGGGQGPLFKFSWGAEDSFVSTAVTILSDLGFRDDQVGK
ncbi:hypothetical protein JR334_10840 [Clostridia bacterium]|nr:hypothetical protein JR334_10840 [Clostridia bacterium]